MYVFVILIAIETKAVPLLLIVTGPEGLCFQSNRFLVVVMENNFCIVGAITVRELVWFVFFSK